MDEKTDLYWFDLNWQGFKNVNDMGGGYVDWVRNKFPVNTPKEEL